MVLNKKDHYKDLCLQPDSYIKICDKPLHSFEKKLSWFWDKSSPLKSEATLALVANLLTFAGAYIWRSI